LDFIGVKRRAHVCWLVANVGLQGLVIEADDEVPTIAIAEGKGAANNFGKSLQLVGADPALTSSVKLTESRARSSSMRDRSAFIREAAGTGALDLAYSTSPSVGT
jgi:hypothetical protein